ncbi:probable serine/threonine-protein kinase ndrA [Bacillus rossius redtenbacheri]|uniref:probable serine/threonine-protein kinase ndrA n=1 Tax=Bacillus rossius redtenbacheri TaxID=93214 RepID=UPI002FDE2423
MAAGRCFEVLAELGRGAFSTVHLVRAQDRRRGRRVQLRPEGAAEGAASPDPGGAVQVLPEGAASPGGFLLHLHYAGRAEEAAFFVVDDAAGGDLTAALEDLGFLPEDQARLVPAQLFAALHTLHSLGDQAHSRLSD